MTEVWTPSALLAANLGNTDFFVEHLSAPGTTLVVFGPREAGKTQLLFTMTRAMHEEALLFNRFRCRQARVALVEVDMSIMTTQERLRKASAEYKFGDDLLSIVTLYTLDIMACNRVTPWVQQLATFDPDVVAFDSLRKIHRGDENNPGTPSPLYSKCRELFPRAGFWFTHHVKKPPATWLMHKEQYDPGEDPNVYRGTTAWLDDADAAIYLHKDAKGRTLRVPRARFAPDSVKDEAIGVKMHKGSMFLELGELSERQWAVHWRKLHPTAALDAAIEALQAEYPNHAKQTYYNWAHAAETV